VKKLLLAVFLFPLAVAHGADDPQPKPGFLGRLWGSTKRVGEKTADVVKSPFRKSAPKDSTARTDWQSLTMTMQLDPAVVKFPETRVLEVTIAVSNKSRKAVQMDFPTSQRIEVLVKNETGRILSRWSDDQRLEKEPGFVLVNPGERLEYAARISTREMVAGLPCQIEAFFPGYDRLRISRTVTPTR
jgi:hypothetical protein